MWAEIRSESSISGGIRGCGPGELFFLTDLKGKFETKQAIWKKQNIGTREAEKPIIWLDVQLRQRNQHPTVQHNNTSKKPFSQASYCRWEERAFIHFRDF